MPLSVRELNKSTRYQHIVSAAQRLFLKLGLDSVQMQDVANEAEVGIATVFRYFPKKDKLIVAVAIQNLERILPAFEQIAALPKSAYERLEDVLNYLLEDQNSPESNSSKFQEAFESYASFTKEPLPDMDDYIEIQKQISNSLIPIIEDGKKDGSIRTDLSIKEALITIINTFGTFVNNVVLKSSISFKEEDIEPHIQQRVLKEILLSYVRPR
ncbi:TetR family transcriptional regulator [Psychrobacillus insolitus]|uniref:TetR family transcriptional regulator n=1 Tax=Psychrobacillus insolitus TaxID=1461 RepID=A0A2W7MPI8_9BACI|nr:TetR/AcrR family transcriptional regulator [Psychrobacillus insolitus]PZX04594.1 TetR family transcriptional regulator [Psychrobacillus insolitus]